MRILITGDVHGYFQQLKYLIEAKKPDLVICCGDFGYWPDHGYNPSEIESPVPILFCDGNHEQHEYLKTKTTPPCFTMEDLPEIAENVFYTPRGSVLELPVLGPTMFMGGAMSIDKHLRTPGVDWFPEEVPNVVTTVIPEVERIDTVISHTCPLSFAPMNPMPYDHMRDNTRQLLENILVRYEPRRFFFGHWHVLRSGSTMGKNPTAWWCLNQAPNNKYPWNAERWWIIMSNETKDTRSDMK